MRTAKALFVVLALGVVRLAAQHPPTAALNQVVDKILLQEQAETESLQQYSPLVESYIQYLRPDKDLGTVPDGDKYFLGHAKLGKSVKLESFIDVSSGGLREFLQMIYIDTNGFDRQHYKFDYLRREFLGEVRCLVFDVTPQEKAAKGRFVGRLWVEDHDYHIVRFNGAFMGSARANHYFHFDSWRVNAGKNEWLPAFIYSEQGDLHNARIWVRIKHFGSPYWFVRKIRSSRDYCGEGPSPALCQTRLLELPSASATISARIVNCGPCWPEWTISQRGERVA